MIKRIQLDLDPSQFDFVVEAIKRYHQDLHHDDILAQTIEQKERKRLVIKAHRILRAIEEYET